MIDRIDLRGEWEFAMGENAPFADTMILPSTTETSHKEESSKNNDATEENSQNKCTEIESTLNGHTEDSDTLYLKRKRPFTGISRYRRYINIPKEWEYKELLLYLERTKYVKVYVDGKLLSESHETIIPQRHLISSRLTTGVHEFILEVDNNLARYEDFPESLLGGHQYTEHTQTNWNGILGQMYLEVLKSLYIERMQVIKCKDTKEFLVQAEVENSSKPRKVSLTFIYQREDNETEPKQVQRYFHLKEGKNFMEVKVQDEDLVYWDEFNPALYKCEVLLEGEEDRVSVKDIAGFSEISITGQTVNINHVPVSLRGNLDCCIYPLTGHAPMDYEAWTNIMRQTKEYGLNHIRFHSWCPPKAAFEAADREGIYLQVELSCFGNAFYPMDNPSCNKVLNHYLYDQSQKVIKEYGNHPSFFIFAVGNEMVGDIKAFDMLLSHLKQIRPDKLYTQGSNNFLEDPICGREDDVWITMRTTKTANVRASFSHGDKPLGHLQWNEPYHTMHDYEEALAYSNIPVISHEIGQYQAFPNLKELDRYTGVTQSTALKIFKERLEQKGMLHLAEDFYRNSGALLVQCYKEEIEAALRTKGLLGLQLLGLQDFSGQGTALVGIWDAFMENKDFITADQWREFCAPAVILFKMEKGIYTAGERVKGQVFIYNYSKEDICKEDLQINLYTHHKKMESNTGLGINASHRETYASLAQRREGDEILGTVILSQVTAERGQLTYTGDVEIQTEQVQKETAAYIELSIGKISNRYPLWIYPDKNREITNEYIFTSYSESAKKALKEGKTVGIFSKNWENSIEGFFASDFWCYPMFKKACVDKGVDAAPGTLGLLIKKEHEALNRFPTESFSSWQWKEIMNNSRPIILDEESEYENIVQVIDNFDRNHNLSILFEKKVYGGKLVVCAMDVLEHLDKAEVRQLYYSLAEYITAGRQ